jgi:glycerophosphoryl diester phosphodiesterase
VSTDVHISRDSVLIMFHDAGKLSLLVHYCVCSIVNVKTWNGQRVVKVSWSSLVHNRPLMLAILLGRINERDWYGRDGMEHARTVKEPKQSIPTFFETLTLLMKVRNSHLSLHSRYPFHDRTRISTCSSILTVK